MDGMESQITSLTIVYSTVYSGRRTKKNIKAPRHWHLCGEITAVTDEFPHKWPVTRKMFSFDDVIMEYMWIDQYQAISRQNKSWAE